MKSKIIKRLIRLVLLAMLGFGLLDWFLPLTLPLFHQPTTGHFYEDFYRRFHDQQDGTRAAYKAMATVVTDYQGRPLRSFADPQGVWRYPVTLEAVSPYYIEALLGYEDRWFWYHPGINPLAILRAMVLNTVNGRIVSGGSTITMQVARLLHPHQRSFTGKLKQMFRALQLEWHFSKAEILTLYLNIAPFGGTLEGVQAASYMYLDKPAAELSHAEAALLAVLPQAPTRYRPDLFPLVAQRARDKVLDRLHSQGIWTQTTIEQAKIESVYGYHASRAQLAPLLARRLVGTYPQQQLIQTTIDGALQQALAAYLRVAISSLPSHTSAAIMVMDNHNGDVKAYLGSADFSDDSRYGHVDMITATRSPGSTLKPFLYGMAIDGGLIHSGSLLADVPRSWASYQPDNFSGGFSGPVSAASALQRSLNVPFIDLLARFGPANFSDRLAAGGLNLSITDNRANLAIILGAAGTSLEQLVTAYSALARQGKSIQPRYILPDLHPTQTQSRSLERFMLTPESAWITYQTLAAISRPNSLNYAVKDPKAANLAWKTGTSYGFRDSWAIGVSPTYTIGVWVGRPDGTPLVGHNGRQSAGPLLFTVADYLHQQISVPPKPPTVAQATICWPLGTLRQGDDDQHCQLPQTAWLINGSVPPTWHRVDSQDWQANPLKYWVNSESGLMVDAGCPVAHKHQREVALWPKVLAPWLAKQWRRSTLLPLPDPQCRGEMSVLTNDLHITGIANNNIYRAAGVSTVKPSIVLAAVGGVGQLHWYINGERQYSVDPQTPVVHPLNHIGEQQIVVVDQQGNVDKVTIRVE